MNFVDIYSVEMEMMRNEKLLEINVSDEKKKRVEIYYVVGAYL